MNDSFFPVLSFYVEVELRNSYLKILKAAFLTKMPKLYLILAVRRPFSWKHKYWYNLEVQLWRPLRARPADGAE